MCVYVCLYMYVSCVNLRVCHPIAAFDSIFYSFRQIKEICFMDLLISVSFCPPSCPPTLSPAVPESSSLSALSTLLFLHLAIRIFFHPSLLALLPSSNVVALISVLDGPVPALLKAWTTTPYWANFFRLSKVYTSLSPVAFISTMLYWPLLPGPFSL